MEVDLEEMALGRKKALMQQQFRAAGVDMPDDKCDQIIKLWKRKRNGNTTDLLGALCCY